MKRTLLVTAFAVTATSSVSLAQANDADPSEHRGTSALFEAAIGTRLGRQPDPGVEDARWFASWEVGWSFNRGNWAWGATGMAFIDEDGARWGIRPRYRRWLGPTTALDIGAGILMGGSSNYGEQTFPGFAGLLGVSYGSWLGVNLELQAISTTVNSPETYIPIQGILVPGVRTESIDWAWLVSAKMNGAGAIALSAAELVLGAIAAASFASSW